MTKQTIIDYIVARGKEPSTYRGLALLLSAIGIAIDPTLLSQIITVGIAISGLIGILFPDPQKPTTPDSK